MYAVGRLSNYISQGVYSVAAPFHPFGGAVDIIVVQQEDGTFKCSPWYVKFGKFQGVLKRHEKIVTVAVNGEEAGFHMYLDHKGEAYFLKEVESDEEETSIFSPPSAPSSGEEGTVDRRPIGRRISFKEEDLKGEEKPEGDAVAEESSNSPPSDGIVIRKNKEGTLISFSEQSPSVEEEQSGNQLLDNSESNSSSTKNGVKNGKILSKAPSKRKSILSYVFRSRSKRFSESHVTASDTDQKDGQGEMSDCDRSSVDRAEIVADLLDSKWATGNGANKEETTGERVVEINSFSSSFGDDAPSINLVSELIEEKRNSDEVSPFPQDKYSEYNIEEKTNSDKVSPLVQDKDSEDSIAKQEDVIEQNNSQKREESKEEDPIQVLSNYNGESTVENCVKIEYSVQHGDDGNSETSITNQDCAHHDDLERQKHSTEGDSVQILYNHDGESMVENCAENSVQHSDSETCPSHTETVFAVEENLSNLNNFGQQTSVNDADQHSEDSTPNQINMNPLVLNITDPIELYEGSRNFNKPRQQTFPNDFACQSANFVCDREKTSSSPLKTLSPVECCNISINVLSTCIKESQDERSTDISLLDLPAEVDNLSSSILDAGANSELCKENQEGVNKIQQATNNLHLQFAKCRSDGQEQTKHKEKQEEEMRQLTSMQELAESPCDCTTSISLSDGPRGCSHLSVSLLVPLDDTDPCTETDEGTKTVHQVVDSTHLQFAKCSSDEQEQMEHKEKQEEDLQQVTSMVELGGSSCDYTSISLSDIPCGSCYLSSTLLVSSDDLGPYAETEEGIKTLQQAPDIEVESTTKGGDKKDKTKCNTISDVESVPHVTHQKEPSRSFCDCDAPKENRTDQKLLLEESSDIVGSLLDHVNDSDPCTESTEEMQSLQQVQDIAVGPLTDSQNYEIERKDFSAKEEEKALVNVMPPKELDGSYFCDFDAPREKRSDQILVPEEAFKCTNAREDMELTMTCNNLINSKLDTSHGTNFQVQHDLGDSESVFRQYEVRKLEFFVSNNKFVKSDQLHVQMEETYSNQTMNESTDGLELTFNEEYVLNDCLALSDLEPPIQEGTREDELSFCTRQEEQAGRSSGDGNPNEEHSFPDQQHDEQCKLSSLSLNITNITNDSNMECSNGNLSHLSRTETIPININIRGMHMEGKVDAMQALRSLPDFGNHFSVIENADAGHVFSRSLDFDSACLKRGINGETLFSNSQNMVRACEKEAAQEWIAREDSSESSQKQHKTDTGNVMVQFNSIDISLCRHLLVEGMGAAAAAEAFDSLRVSSEQFLKSQTGITKNENLVVRMGGQYFPWEAAAPIILGMAVFGLEGPAEPEGAIPVERVEKTLEKYASDSFVTPSNGWKLWPFSFRKSKTPERSKSAQIMPRNDLIGSESEASLQGSFDGSFSDYYRKASKRKVRSNTPTSEQLASLKLKEGQNLITFTFSTRVLGKQQVDARIYLWKWNTRIVISDVDGTITKSDVLGQFMPLVGKDWTQSGVAHLFSAIKDNGYQLLFLSARAIAQAYLTRQFLLNIKQDGKALPDGPIVISPDGLFPSLYREVIRRAPHEFKIACLEDIRKLFPPDCNPFYAGFGNRNTDEISYLKVGIPKGKIFIINPKGEVAVNHRVDMKSYTSLHSLVNGMFPAMSSSEQEDFNSWNYWRMPLPDIDV